VYRGGPRALGRRRVVGVVVVVVVAVVGVVVVFEGAGARRWGRVPRWAARHRAAVVVVGRALSGAGG